MLWRESRTRGNTYSENWEVCNLQVLQITKKGEGTVQSESRDKRSLCPPILWEIRLGLFPWTLPLFEWRKLKTFLYLFFCYNWANLFEKKFLQQLGDLSRILPPPGVSEHSGELMSNFIDLSLWGLSALGDWLGPPDHPGDRWYNGLGSLWRMKKKVKEKLRTPWRNLTVELIRRLWGQEKE